MTNIRTEKTPELLIHGNYYHIYNKGVNGINLFYSNANYQHFLNLYDDYISTIAETYAWCLMPNHFHLLVRIKEEEEIGYYLPLTTDKSNDPARFKTTGSKNLSEFLQPDRVLGTINLRKPNPSRHFGHLFNAYAKALNEQKSRTGALFERPFDRIKVDSENYFRRLVVYIHNNPVKHSFVKDCIDWPWSSYKTIISIKPTKLKREKVIGWFNNEANFINSHSNSENNIDEILMLE